LQKAFQNQQGRSLCSFRSRIIRVAQAAFENQHGAISPVLKSGK
jgi:hypothetical protein